MIKYKKYYKYQLYEDYSYQTGIFGHECNLPFLQLNQKGELILKTGYAWDGPSGPTFDTKTFMRGSLIHDALYQLLRNSILPKIYKQVADNILYKVCIEDGMNKFRAWYIRKSMIFSNWATKPKNERKLLTAP